MKHREEEDGTPWRSMTEHRITFALKIVILAVLALYLGQFLLAMVEHVRTIVFVLIGAVFFAYLIYPFVNRLHKRMPLGLAILVVYAVLAVVVAFALWMVVPRLVDETATFVRYYPDMVVRVNSFVNDPSDPLAANLPPWMRAEIARIPAETAVWLKLHGVEAAGHVMFVLAGTFALVATFVIVPLLAAYLLLDLEHLKRMLQSVVPAKRWDETVALLVDFDHVVGGFIRGQMLVALSVGVMITIALLILHVRYAFLLGLLAAVGDLIPYVGAVLAGIPAVISALAGNGWVNALIVLGAFVLIFQIEGHVLAPNVVSKTVKLSPFIVMIALLTGAELGGILGMLVAVPIAGMLRVLARRVFRPPAENHAQP